MHGCVPGRVAAQSCEKLAKFGAVPMAQDQALRDGVAQRADADLQRAAVGNEAGGMESGRVVGERDRFARRRE